MNLVMNERPEGVAVVNWAEPSVLDASNVADFREEIGKIEQNYSRIVLDMSDVEFIDSSMIGALVGLLRRVREVGGELKLAALTPDVETIFELTRLQRVFPIYPSVDSSLEDFGLASS